MTKSELVKTIASAADIPVGHAEAVIDQMPALFAAILQKEGKLRIPGLASFELRHVEEREVRNPRTGEKFVAPAKNKVTIRPLGTLKELVQ